MRSSCPATPASYFASPLVRLLTAPVLALFACLCCLSCTPEDRDSADVAQGVTFQRDPSGFQTIDLDLATARVRPVVVAEEVSRHDHNYVGDAYTVLDWCNKFNAVGGINGGFFGDTYDDIGTRKQIVQLAVVDGKVVAPGSDVASTRNPGERYLHSVIGFHADGTPEIAWATGTMKGVLRDYGSPTNPIEHRDWSGIRSAAACGPRLFAGGVQRITDHEERLVRPGKLVRSFISYDTDGDGKPLHLVIGRADAADYPDIATFLATHFQAKWQTKPQEAMCLDGGTSSQLVYKTNPNGSLADAEPTGVRVPTAILLLPK